MKMGATPLDPLWLKRLYATCKLNRCICYRSWVIGEGIFNLWRSGISLVCSFTFWEYATSTFFAPMTLTLTDDLHIRTWPVLPGDTMDAAILCRGFWKLSSDRHTEMHTYIQTDRMDRNYKSCHLIIIAIFVLTYVCLWLCTASVDNTTQNSSDNLPSYLQTNIIAQMLSIGGRGGDAKLPTDRKTNACMHSSYLECTDHTRMHWSYLSALIIPECIRHTWVHSSYLSAFIIPEWVLVNIMSLRRGVEVTSFDWSDESRRLWSCRSRSW